MAQFDDLIEAQLAGATIRAAHLVEFDFKSAPKRLWPGFGDLLAGGETWQGVGEHGRISGIESGTALAAEEMTFTLFGEAGLLDNIADDGDESAGRTVNVYLQFFDIRQIDEAGNAVDWAVLDDMLVMFAGTMGPLTATIAGPSDERPGTRIISVPAVSAFSNRNRPALAYFSDRDQQGRSPGDNFCVRVSAYSEGSVTWPVF